MAGSYSRFDGRLGMFLYGMKLMSDALEKAAGAKMRSILEFFTKTPLRGYSRRNIFYGGNPVLKRVYCYGSQLCKLRSDESLSGGGSDHGCQYWHYSNFAADFFESVCACAGNRYGRCGYGNVLQKKQRYRERERFFWASVFCLWDFQECPIPCQFFVNRHR